MSVMTTCDYQEAIIYDFNRGREQYNPEHPHLSPKFCKHQTNKSRPRAQLNDPCPDVSMERQCGQEGSKEQFSLPGVPK